MGKKIYDGDAKVNMHANRLGNLFKCRLLSSKSGMEAVIPYF